MSIVNAKITVILSLVDALDYKAMEVESQRLGERIGVNAAKMGEIDIPSPEAEFLAADMVNDAYQKINVDTMMEIYRWYRAHKAEFLIGKINQRELLTTQNK